MIPLMIGIERGTCERVPFYCEENIWRLLARSDLAVDEAWVVIVSSPSKRVALLRQMAGRPGDGLVNWDYHVFSVASDSELGCLVLDVDSALPFPCPAFSYLEATFGRPARRGQEPLFRIMPAAFYVAKLSSDRSHMRGPDGGWLAPPPGWPAPGDPGERNLLSWIDLALPSPGMVVDLGGFESFIRYRQGSGYPV